LCARPPRAGHQDLRLDRRLVFRHVCAACRRLDLSRYMGASLTMIDWQHGHLARDGRADAINLLDAFASPGAVDVRAVELRGRRKRHPPSR
jgi:hypothetical protein